MYKKFLRYIFFLLGIVGIGILGYQAVLYYQSLRTSGVDNVVNDEVLPIKEFEASNYIDGWGNVMEINSDTGDLDVEMEEGSVMHLLGTNTIFSLREYVDENNYEESRITINEVRPDDVIVLLQESDEEGKVIEDEEKLRELVVMRGEYVKDSVLFY